MPSTGQTRIKIGKSLSLPEQDIAEAIAMGFSSGQLAKKFGGRNVHWCRVMRGDRRPHIRAKALEIVDGARDTHAMKIKEACGLALQRLIDALRDEDHKLAVQAAHLIATDFPQHVQDQKAGEVDIHFVARLTATVDELWPDRPKEHEGVIGGRWSNTHRVDGNGKT